jgi:uncharacterized delta-60 repeat protein
MKCGFETKAENGPGDRKSAFVPPSVEQVAKLFPQLEIIELLGQGGMGAVYKARQPRLNRFVALKILSPEKRTDPRFAERFEREARALAWLDHPNIVTVYDFGEMQGNFYLLMEFVDGMTLRQLLQARSLASAEALAIVAQICQALQYAHEQGIIHRDIKPENILLDKKGRVKIADFGLAKLLVREPQNISLTGAADVVGTAHYMAPEQIEKPQTVDHRADIYSLGVVFYEMLTGELPLGNFQPPSQKVQIDVRLDDVVLHALEKEPERRYQKASEVETAVDTIASTTAPSPQPNSAAEPEVAHQEHSHRRMIWLSGALVAMVVLALVGWIVPHLIHNVAPAAKAKPTVTGPASSPSPVSNPPERLAPAGSIDTTFNPQAGVNVEIHCIGIQRDGKIVVGGYFSAMNNVERPSLGRLNPDGSLDGGFAVSVQGAVHALAIQADGRIVIAGDFGLVNGETRNAVARLDPDGSLDRTFNPGAGGNLEIRSVAVQSDNKIIVGGSFTTFNHRQGYQRIVRLQVDGRLDTSFNPKPSAGVSAIAIQQDGKIVNNGSFSLGQGPLTRIARLNAGGSLDASFHAEANNHVSSVALQSDGKILMAGNFTAVNGVERNRICRLNSDGSVDETFQPDNGINTPISRFAVQGNGQIVIGGGLPLHSSLPLNCIARLNADGGLDPTFNPRPRFNDAIQDLAIQPGNGIVVASSFTTTNGVVQHRVLRLHDRASKID